MVVASLKCSGSDFVSCIFTVFFLPKISTIILKTSERLCCTKKTKSAHQITKFLGKRTVPSHTSVCVSVWRLCIQEFWFFVCFCRKYTEMLRQPPTHTDIHTHKDVRDREQTSNERITAQVLRSLGKSRGKTANVNKRSASFFPVFFNNHQVLAVIFCLLVFRFEDYLYNAHVHSHYAFKCVSTIVASHTRHNF